MSKIRSSVMRTRPLELQILTAFKQARLEEQWEAAEHLFCALEAMAKTASNHRSVNRGVVIYSAALFATSPRNHS